MSCEIFGVFMLILVGEMVSGDQLSAATSRFSQNLYQVVALKEENVVYSPLSIHLALSFVWYGARGTTAAQMADTLGLTLVVSPHRAYRRLIFELNTASDVVVYLNNALFLKPNFPIEPDFVREAEGNYFSLASNFDLDAPGGPEKPINDFVKEKTHGAIKEILPRGTIDSNTVLVLINTLFFNGTWKSPFSKDLTRKQDFYKLNGDTIEVDMMRGTSQAYIKNDDQNGIDIVQLPFKNDRFGLTIVLPREVDGIDKLESLLQFPHIVDEFFIGLEYDRVALSIPKFKIETELSLKKPLQELGLKDAFNPGLADFAGISPNDIYITAVLHKAVIEVQESGTVAAAVTAVTVGLRSLPRYSFIANHPFIFFLRDNENKQILFQGKFSA